MSFDEANSRLIIVGDNGLARKAQTSQQLHAALSVSIWDLSNMRQPVMAGMAGAKQVSRFVQCCRFCCACLHSTSSCCAKVSASEY